MVVVELVPQAAWNRVKVKHPASSNPSQRRLRVFLPTLMPNKANPETGSQVA